MLERNGHTEATVDLARMAGLTPAGVLCEIVTEVCQKRPAYMVKRATVVDLARMAGLAPASVHCEFVPRRSLLTI